MPQEKLSMDQSGNPETWISEIREMQKASLEFRWATQAGSQQVAHGNSNAPKRVRRAIIVVAPSYQASYLPITPTSSRVMRAPLRRLGR
jgi:hypothetical protein